MEYVQKGLPLFCPESPVGIAQHKADGCKEIRLAASVLSDNCIVAGMKGAD